MSTDNILSTSWDTYTDHLLPLIGAVLLMLIILWAANFVMSLVLGGTALMGLATGSPGGAFAGFGLAAIVMLLVAAAIGVQFNLALAHQADRALQGNRPSLSSSISVTTNRIVPAILAFMLLGIAVGLGTMALILPGLYIGIRLFPALPVAALEEVGPIETLKRSWSLSEGETGSVAAVFIVVTLLYMGSSFLARQNGLVGLGGAFLQFGVAVPFGAVASTATYRALLPAGGRRSSSTGSTKQIEQHDGEGGYHSGLEYR